MNSVVDFGRALSLGIDGGVLHEIALTADSKIVAGEGPSQGRSVLLVPDKMAQGLAALSRRRNRVE